METQVISQDVTNAWTGSPVGEAVLLLNTAIDAVAGLNLEFAGDKEVRGLLAGLEHCERRLASAQIATLDAVDERGLYSADGHFSAKVTGRHVARLSNGEAAGRDKTMRMFRELPDVAAAFAAGSIGVDQVRLLAPVFANPRVRSHMFNRQGRFIADAINRSYRNFELNVRGWERLTDDDGPTPANERKHANRDARMIQDFDLGWEPMGHWAAMQGATMSEVLGHYIDAEVQTDWAKAKAEHGDRACFGDLERTDAQRRADALCQIFRDAASSPHGAGPPGYVHNIVWDKHAYEEMLSRLDGNDPQPLDPDTYRCSTLDGTPLEPLEAATNSLRYQVRRVLIDATSVTIDLGQARFFTGSARHAVLLQHPECVWPGCPTPASKCETDHIKEHSRGGRTCPGNGAPLCGPHNRWKQKGFTIQRHPNGRCTTHRPNGTQID